MDVVRYEDFFHLSLDMLCIASTEGYFVELNPAWERVLGHTQEELKARPFVDFVHPDDRRATLEEAALLSGGRDTVRFVNRYRTKGGDYRWLLWSSRLSEDGHWFLAVARDITDLKEHEQHLLAARRQAEAASEAKSQFLANMSHELRTPLNAIIGFANVLATGRAGPLTAQQADAVARVRKNGVALLALINDVLDISKIETGHLTMHVEPVDLGLLVLRALEPFEQQAGRKGLRLVPSVPGGLAPVVADAQRLEQIVLNLVGNAVKFTERGVVEVRVVHRDGTPQRLDVVDTGIGLGPNDRERLFEAFVQVDASPAKEFAGTGLGLSISRALARRMGFDLAVDSSLGGGSVFSVVFTAAADPPYWERPESPEQPDPQGPTRSPST